MQEMWILLLGREDHLEEEMTIHSTILAWKIPWTEQIGDYRTCVEKELDMTEHTHTHTDILDDIL